MSKKGREMKFKAHQSFYIRQGWLYKGVKQVAEKADFFSDKSIDQTMELGIGSNMVTAVRYWLQAVGLTKEEKINGQKLTDFGNLVKKYDSHQQKIGTLLWMHYSLVKNKDLSTAFHIFFNSPIFEFDKERFLEVVNDFVVKNNGKLPAEKSVLDDFDCLLHTYAKKIDSSSTEIDFEDLICPFSELRLLKKTKNGLRKIAFNIEKIPDFIALAMIFDANKKTILEQTENTISPEITISEIESGENSLGRVFNLGISEVGNLLDRLKINGFIEITRTANIEVLRFTKKVQIAEDSALKLLERYYGDD